MSAVRNYLCFVVAAGLAVSTASVFTQSQAKGGFKAEPGRWIGAKMGLFCTRTTQINDSGFADFDWFRIEPLNDKL